MGGAGTLVGPLVGDLIWLYLFEVLQFVDAVGPYWRLVLGVIFVILVTVFRRGICGEFIAWRDKRMTRRIERADTSSPSVPRVHGGQLVMRQSVAAAPGVPVLQADRKSTRLNSSH